MVHYATEPRVHKAADRLLPSLVLPTKVLMAATPVVTEAIVMVMAIVARARPLRLDTNGYFAITYIAVLFW